LKSKYQKTVLEYLESHFIEEKDPPECLGKRDAPERSLPEIEESDEPAPEAPERSLLGKGEKGLPECKSSKGRRFYPERPTLPRIMAHFQLQCVRPLFNSLIEKKYRRDRKLPESSIDDILLLGKPESGWIKNTEMRHDFLESTNDVSIRELEKEFSKLIDAEASNFPEFCPKLTIDKTEDAIKKFWENQAAVDRRSRQSKKPFDEEQPLIGTPLKVIIEDITTEAENLVSKSTSFQKKNKKSSF
jgi:hypothetical protein